MAPQKRRDLTPHEKQVANRVRALWLQKKQRDNTTQTAAAKEMGWTTATFGQYTLGGLPIGPKALGKIAKYLGVSVYDLDPTLADTFTPPPEDLVDINRQLDGMSDDDIRRLISDLSRKLPQTDLLRLVALLTDRAIERG